MLTRSSLLDNPQDKTVVPNSALDWEKYCNEFKEK